jgi:hypothetical protein
MNEIDDLKAFYGLVTNAKLRTDEERVADARKRERRRRQRKEELYSFSPKVVKSVKSRKTLP